MICIILQGNTNQNCHEISLHTHKDAYDQKESVGKSMWKVEPLYVTGRKVKWYCFLENSMIVPQKVKHKVTM